MRFNKDRLALLAGIDDRDAISRFLSKTFLSSQMNPETLEARTDDVLYWLCENGMIERRGESKLPAAPVRDF